MHSFLGAVRTYCHTTVLARLVQMTSSCCDDHPMFFVVVFELVDGILLGTYLTPILRVHPISSTTHPPLSCRSVALQNKLGTKNSIGIIVSLPYTILNGVCCVNFLQVIL